LLTIWKIIAGLVTLLLVTLIRRNALVGCTFLAYDLLGAKQRYEAYARYVGPGLDDEAESFYGKGNQSAILGGENFVQRVKYEHGEKSN
jgi:hypothetical protein